MTNTIPKINLEQTSFITSDDSLRKSALEFINQWNDSSDFFTTKTSGSTGIPKEIRLSKKLTLNSIAMSANFFGFSENSILGLALSLDSIAGKMQLLRALTQKAKLLVLENTKNPLANLRTKIDFITLVPYQLEHILAETPEKIKLCDKILLGGAKLNLATERKLKNYNSKFYESYGMTETYSHVAIRNISNNEKTFKALNGVDFYEEKGILCINAPHLELLDLKTNDCVHLHSEKEFTLIGRSDFVINSAGIKIHPELLEEKLAPQVDATFYIIGENDQKFGEIVTLFVEKHYSVELEQKLQYLFDTVLEKYEKPKKIYFEKKFIRTLSGKINRLETQKIAFES